MDDTDLLHINMTRVESPEETHKALQASITSWGSKLLTTGGVLQPSKCFYDLIDFEWLPDGTWRYYWLDENEWEQLKKRYPWH